jgi:hypothetical protein
MPDQRYGKSDLTMPNLEQELAKLLGAKGFAKLDFAQGYWQLPLAGEAALVLAFRGVDGLYASTRVPYGAKNAAVWFQYLASQSLAISLIVCNNGWMISYYTRRP